MDFYRQWRPQADGAALVRAGRITTLVFMVIAVRLGAADRPF
jgi:hypothetical protein